ncbi:MAG: hypothetical protein ACI4OR_01105 [Alphaproteobacteria bacterium]
MIKENGGTMKPEKDKKDRDILGAYPEKEQVDAFPERRYVRLTRFLTIFTIINLAMVIAWSGFYFYMAQHKDISVSQRNWVHIYTIDPERKLLLPSEFGQGSVPALQLMMEKALRQYITERYEYIWAADEMRKRWGKNGYVARLSGQEVLPKFNAEAGASWNEIQQKRVTRDVHIYSLYPLRGDLWSAYIETFDLPLDENLEKKCDCSDNSHECIACKEQNMVSKGRRRKKILLRANFNGIKNLDNPLGVMVYAYYPAVVPIPKEGADSEKFWNLPPALRPAL